MTTKTEVAVPDIPEVCLKCGNDERVKLCPDCESYFCWFHHLPFEHNCGVETRICKYCRLNLITEPLTQDYHTACQTLTDNFNTPEPQKEIDRGFDLIGQATDVVLTGRTKCSICSKNITHKNNAYSSSKGLICKTCAKPDDSRHKTLREEIGFEMW